MAEKLKTKVVHGFAWNAAEKVASALFQAWVNINVANRLFPDDYALKAIFAAFVIIFNSFVDSGFSQALIRKKEVSATDCSSAFWFNTAVSAAVYAILVGLSYPSAILLKMPDLVRFAPVFFLVVPLGALGIIQQTVLTREFDFRRLSTITLSSTVVSGFVSVGLAVSGFGFWAIVAQRVTQTGFRSLLLWIFGRWRPRARLSLTSIKEMFGYGSRLLGTDLLNNVFNSIPSFVIGRIHHGTLGNYNQANSVRDLPVNATMSSMQSTTFPALAAISGDGAKFSRAVGRVVGSAVFIMFPMMAGLIVVADELFGVFLAPQWQASVPFFRILCLAGFATPIAVVSSNILRTRSDGKAVLRAEIVKKVFAVLMLAATIPFGAVAIAWGVVGIAFSDAAVSFWFARRRSDYGSAALARGVLPTLGLTAVMAAAVWFGGGLLGDGICGMAGAGWPQWAILTAKTAIGAAFYAAGAALLRLDALDEFMEIVRKVTVSDERPTNGCERSASRRDRRR